MKSLLAFLTVLVLVTTSSWAQSNAEFYFVQPDDWDYTPKQMQVDLHYSSVVDFFQLTGTMRVTLVNSDGILDTIIPARFPKRNAFERIDSTKWSFVNFTSGNDQDFTYTVRYMDSNYTDDFRKGNDIIMLEEFILFEKWPTRGQVIVTMYNIDVINVNNQVQRTNDTTVLTIDFGSGPQKQRPTLEIVLPELKADAQSWYADLYLTNEDYSLSGIFMPDFMIDSCLVVDRIEAKASQAWSTVINLSFRDQGGNDHYNFVALANSVADYLPKGPRQHIYRLWFQPKTGCLEAGRLVSLALYGAEITDDATPINIVPVDDFATSIRVAPGDLPCPKGDPDLDGDRDLDDVIFLLEYLVNIVEFDYSQYCAADVDSNDRVNLVDGVLMIRYLNSPFGIFEIMPKNNNIYLDGAGALILKGDNLKTADISLAGEAYQFVEYSKFIGDTAYVLKFSENYRYYGDITFNSDAIIGRGYQLTTGQPSVVIESGGQFQDVAKPNPFRDYCTISYSLNYDTRVTVTIHNDLGVKVATLVDEKQTSGEHQVTFKPSRELSQGTYHYLITTTDFMSRVWIQEKRGLIVYLK